MQRQCANRLFSLYVLCSQLTSYPKPLEFSVNNSVKENVFLFPFYHQSLQLQLETRDQTIMSLKSQVESYKFAELPHRDTDNIVSSMSHHFSYFLLHVLLTCTMLSPHSTPVYTSASRCLLCHHRVFRMSKTVYHKPVGSRFESMVSKIQDCFISSRNRAYHFYKSVVFTAKRPRKP